jgi:hypothetical protein
MTDLGQEAIDYIYAQLGAEGQWANRTDRGFTWWAGPFAQRIWVDKPVRENGEEVFRICAKTDLFRDFDFEASGGRLSVLNMVASVSAIVPGQKDTTRLSHFASWYLHEGNAAWGMGTFAAIAALQVSDAHIKGDPRGTVGLRA